MSRCIRILLSICLGLFALQAYAQCPAGLPAANITVPGPLPLFPSDNWWNADISAAPVDPGSFAFINYINNGGTRKLHPDFGGEVSPGSQGIYGMPYAIVDGAQAKQAVTFQYWDESDGVNYSTQQGIPFYPIPAQAITQPHWVEGGAPANVDQRSSSDRHLLIIDCTNRHLYELYNVYYNTTQAKWYAGSGAFFDMKTNDRRPDTWTSADAAGLAIFPGLVRYDEAWNPAITDIGHAFRVTVRSTNGYVYPASHRAGSAAGALPMGARLRLKKTVAGTDPVLRTSDPNVQKIFRAMQKYGLIVADNGTDMYITGTFDTRWNNGILNPAFALLSASDFEVIQLGWKPTAAPAPALASIAVSPASVTGGTSATGTVTLTAAAASPLAVSLSSASTAVSVPSSVTVAAGASSATFNVTTSAVASQTVTSITAAYSGVQKTTTFTVNPPPVTGPALASLTLSRTSIVGGFPFDATVTISAPAPAAGITVSLTSSNAGIVTVPATVTIPAGATSKSVTLATSSVRRENTVTITASYAGVSRAAAITIKRK